jgi:uncharacterized protein HemX
MVQAVGAPLSAAYSSTAGGTAGLQGQLSRYEKELSACVNCDSALTLEGKQKIQEVSDRIAQIKARIEQLEVAKASRAEHTAVGGSESGAATGRGGAIDEWA